MNGKDRQKLLLYISEVSFALLDVTLYLDTHPEDKEALEYYNQYKNMRHEALKEYEHCFGPLLSTDVNVQNGWQWTYQPWPWEGGCK